MKVLILSMDASKNAKSAAVAISEQFEKSGITTDIVDSLILVPEKSDALVHWNSSGTYRSLSKRAGKSHFLAEKYAAQTLFHLCAPGAEALHSVLATGAYDFVLCVHIFSCMMMTAVQEKYKTAPPFYFVATDYTTAAGISQVNATGYFIPHRMLFGDFIRCGFSADKLYATGIPIRPQFYAPKTEQAVIREQLDLPRSGRLVLLRSGIMQKISARKIHALLGALPNDVYLVALCGTNDKIFGQLTAAKKERLIALSGNLDPFPYLQVADLCLARPRGLFCAEAIACGVPLVLYRESRGVEARNFDFLVKSGVADGSSSWRDVIQSTVLLLTDENTLHLQMQAAHTFLPSNPADQICRILLRSKAAAERKVP